MPTLFGTTFSREDLARLTGDAAQTLGVRLTMFADGAERGLRVLEFNTGGGLRFNVVLDRGMDVGEVHMGSAQIGWRSPAGFRAPWLHDAEGEGGLGFLRSFSGFMNTCGLDHVMGPTEEDAAHYNHPGRRSVRHALHGRICYTPARIVGYGASWDGDECVLWAEGEVRQAAVFAENLLLRRRIETQVGSSTIVVRDEVVNEGFHPTPHMLLYHINLGWPLLAPGAEFRAPIARSVRAGGNAPFGYRVQSGPQSRCREVVYEHDVVAAPSGWALAALINRNYNGARDPGLAFAIEYRQDNLPILLQWQNLQEGAYVMGIEPSTVRVGTRAEHAARGEIVWLERGEKRAYELRFTALSGASDINALERRIEAMGAQPDEDAVAAA